MVSNCKKGVSSCKIARALNVTQKTARLLDHRIRMAFGMEAPDKLTGEVEADETFIGQKARNMQQERQGRDDHWHGRERQDDGDGNSGARVEYANMWRLAPRCSRTRRNRMKGWVSFAIRAANTAGRF